MLPIIQSYKRVWLCTMRKLRPFVTDFVDGQLTPHRVELLKKIWIHDVNGGIFQSLLVADFAVCKSSISRMLSKMERDGFIERFYVLVPPGHKFVRLTERGRAIIEKLKELFADLDQPHKLAAEAFLGSAKKPIDYTPLFRVLNWIRIRLEDDAPALHPWRLHDVYENIGIGDGPYAHWVSRRLRPDDFDDTIEGEGEAQD